MKKLVFLFLGVSLGFFCSSCKKEVFHSGNFIHLSTVVDSKLYRRGNSDGFKIENATIEGDKLKVKIATGGCSADAIVCRLVDSGLLAESWPVQRFVRIDLKNGQSDCKMLIVANYTFDLKSLRVEGDNKVSIGVEGWNKELIYVY